VNEKINTWNWLTLGLWRGDRGSGLFSSGTLVFRTIGDFEFMAISSAGKPTLSDSLNEMRKASGKLFTEISVNGLHCVESAHNVFAFLNSDSAISVVASTKFWKASQLENTPLLFCYMLNFTRGGNRVAHQREIENGIKKLTESLKSSIKEEDYIFYHSLSSCDALMFLKTNSYKVGHGIICLLEQTPSLQYSYSLCGIYWPEDIKIRNNVISKIKNDKVKKLAMCYILGERAPYKNWNTAFEMRMKDCTSNSEIHIFERLGSEDRVINMHDVFFQKLVSEMQGNNGVLSVENPDYRNGLVRPRIHIDISERESETKITGELENCARPIILEDCARPVKLEPYPKRRYLMSQKGYYDKAEQLFRPYDDCYDNNKYPREARQLIRALRAALCSLDQLLMRNFAPEVLDCVDNTFNLFLDKLKRSLEMKNGRFTKDIISSIDNWLSTLMSIVNGALQSERIFFQSPGFNTNLFDTPGKLLHFSTAFTWKLTGLLIELDEANDKCVNKFFLRPSLSDLMSIDTLFFFEANAYDRFMKDCSDKMIYRENPLSRVNIPVPMFFTPRDMVVELAHELAHRVGIDIRKRKYRFTFEVQMALAVVVGLLFLPESDDTKYKMDYLPVKRILSKATKEDAPELSSLMRMIYDEPFKGWLKRHTGKQKEATIDKLHEVNKIPIKIADTENVIYASEYTGDWLNVILKDFLELFLPYLADRHNEKSDLNTGSYRVDIFTRTARDNLNHSADHSDDYLLVSFLRNKIEYDRWISKKAYDHLHDIENCVRAIRKLTRESYADMFMMIALGMTAEEYVRYIYERDMAFDQEERYRLMKHDVTLERIISVLRLFKAGSSGENGLYECAEEPDKTIWDEFIELWEDDTPDWISNDEGSSLFFSGLRWFTYPPKTQEDKENYSEMRSLPVYVIDRNIEYLRLCHKSFRTQGVGLYKHFKPIRTLYQQLITINDDSSLASIEECLKFCDEFSLVFIDEEESHKAPGIQFGTAETVELLGVSETNPAK